MAIKKKPGLRDRTQKASLASKIHEFKQNSVDTAAHGNPLLKLSKMTKKDKQQSKTASFNERIAQKLASSNKICKSSRKRRNRKEREQLKPKLDDLLQNLPVAEASEPKYTKSAKPVHRHNPQKHTGHTRLLAEENQRFAQVLSNEQFQQSPFAALKAAIAQNLK